MKWPAALVNADGVTNLQLTGEGTIDGSGERWWHEYWTARAAEKNDIDPHFKIGRPRLVHIIRSKNITGAGFVDEGFGVLEFATDVLRRHRGESSDGAGARGSGEFGRCGY